MTCYQGYIYCILLNMTHSGISFFFFSYGKYMLSTFPLRMQLNNPQSVHALEPLHCLQLSKIIHECLLKLTYLKSFLLQTSAKMFKPCLCYRLQPLSTQITFMTIFIKHPTEQHWTISQKRQNVKKDDKYVSWAFSAQLKCCSFREMEKHSTALGLKQKLVLIRCRCIVPCCTR